MFSTCAWSSFTCAFCACAHFGIVTTVVIAASGTERRKSRFVNIFGTPSSLQFELQARMRCSQIDERLDERLDDSATADYKIGQSEAHLDVRCWQQKDFYNTIGT